MTSRPPIRRCDPDDPRLAPFAEVRDPGLVRAQGRFVVEGRRLVAQLLETEPTRLEALVVTPAARAALEGVLERLPAGCEVLLVESSAALARIAGIRFHQGCLALARLPAPRTPAEILPPVGSGASLWLVLETVTDPDNVGALFRTAAGLGADGVLLSPGCAHPLYRKALRTSLGAALLLPFAEDAAWPRSLDDLAARGFARLALTPREAALPLDTLLERPLDRVALLLGSEATGLSDVALARAEIAARIPMTARVDSLNVAAAGAIALWALGRRRLAPRG